MSYENPSLYQRRQPLLSAPEPYQIGPLPPAPQFAPIGDLFSGLGSVASQVLEHVQRPGGAVRGFLGESFAGRDPFAGALTGFQEPERFSPQSSIWEALPEPLRFPLTGPLTFGAEMATDPLNFIPGASIAGRLGRAAQLAPPLTRGLELTAGLLTGSPLPEPTALARGARALASAEIPALSRIFETGVRLISPRILEEVDPEIRGLGKFLQDESQLQPQLDVAMAKVRDWFQSIPDLPDETGRIKGLPYGDIYENVAGIREQILSPRHQDWLREVQTNVFEPIAGQNRSAFERLMVGLPEGEFKDSVFKRFAVDWTEDPEAYFPRFYTDPKTGRVIEGVRDPKLARDPQAAFEHERQFLTVDEALKKGYVPIDPVEAAERHVREMLQETHRMELIEQIAPDLAVRNEALRAAQQTALTDAKDEYRATQHVFAWADNVATGRSEPARKQLGWLAHHRPDLYQEVRSIDPADLSSFTENLLSEAQSMTDRIGALSRETGGPPEDALREANITWLKGLWMDDKLAGALERRLAEDKAVKGAMKQVVAAASTVASGSRSAALGLDFASLTLQQLMALPRDPIAFFQSVAKGAEAGFKTLIHGRGGEEVMNRLYSSELGQRVYGAAPNLLREGVSGSRITAPEFFELGEQIRKLPRVGEALSQVHNAFQDYFAVAGNVLRAELMDTMLEGAQRSGTVRETAETVNHITGVLNPKAMGLSETQRQVEGGMLLLAPRWLRATLALVGDAALQGKAGGEARRALASFVGVGTTMYAHMAHAAGQEPIFDPADGRFFTLEVGDTRVGIGHVMIPLVRALARTVADPGKALSLQWDNPLIRFWRARTPAPTSFFLDALSGETMNYEAIQPNNFHKLVLSRALPLSIMNFIEEGASPGAKVGQFAAGQVGLRAFEESRQDTQNEIARNLYGHKFEELSPEQSARVMEKVRAEGKEIPSGPSFERQRGREAAFRSYAEKVEQKARLYEAGRITGEDFRHAVQDAAGERSLILDQYKPDPTRKPTDPKRAAYQEYLAALNTRDEYGRRDYDGANAFLTSLPAEQQAYIQGTLMAAPIALGPLGEKYVTEMRAGQAKARPYFEILDRTLERFGLEAWWDKANPAERTAFLHSPKGRLVMGRVEQLRDVARYKDRELDDILVKWYGNTPIRMRQR